MKFFNLGLAEIIFIAILAFIVLGPGNMVKTARDLGKLVRKITHSPYWQEVWASRRELNEFPKILAREAQIDETLRDLDLETRGVQSSLRSSISDLVREVEDPIAKTEQELKGELSPSQTTDAQHIQHPET